MKKFAALFTAILLLMLSTVSFAAAYDYAVAEAEFDIPDEFSVLYGEEDMPATEVFGFIAEDNSVELSCYYLENSDGISFSFMNLPDAVDYFFDNMSEFDSSDFTLDYVQNYHSDAGSASVMFEGAVKKSGKNVPVEVYAFSTDDNIYAFEFIVYNKSGRYLIDEIVGSIYIDDYASYSDADDYDSDDDYTFLFSIVIFVLSGAVSFIKSKKKPNAGNKQNNKPTKQVEAQPRPTFKKFELNGKDINAFNERFTVGKADDNFAQSELERERKDREKMFL